MPYEEETALTHHKEQGPPGRYPSFLINLTVKGQKMAPVGTGAIRS